MSAHDTHAGAGGISSRVPPSRIDVERQNSSATLLVAGLSVAAFVASTAGPDSRIVNGPVLCPFRLITNLPCPGCGLTRSWVALAQGDVTGSLTYHPLGWAFLLIAGWVVARTLISIVSGATVPPLSRIVSPPTFGLLAGASIAFGWTRILYLLSS